ncbi:VanW family protein [Gordonia sp. NPDC003422]
MATRVAVVVVAVLCLVLATDVVLTRSVSARGATIAGIEVGNQGGKELEPALAELTRRAGQPVVIATDSGSVEFTATELGLTFDAEATRDRLLTPLRNPVVRLLGIVGRGPEVAPVVRLDRKTFDAALDAERRVLERAAIEGGVHYAGAEPRPDRPTAGLRIARDRAADVLMSRWLDGAPVHLPMEPFSPSVTSEVVDATVAGVAKRATAGELTVTGRRDVKVEVSPEQLGSILTFVADGRGGLVPRVDPGVAKGLLNGDLARSQSIAKNASFRVTGGAPRVVPSVDGARINWTKTADAIAAQAVSADGARTVAAVYDVVPPRLTTAGARRLGVKEVVSEYTTGDFSSASGENIRLVAAEVDGAVVLPGKVFSLNTYTGPRGSAQGYVTSTIIDHGRAAKAVGGGISQFATTLYNAAYFAGLEDVDHTEHAYYISRYPEAREATVFEGAIDLQFRNNTRHGIYIETSWSSSSVTVRMWSTTTVKVESITGERTAITAPERVSVPKGDDCIASSGSKGFTTSNTRIIRDARTGAEISRHTRTVRYAPEPIVKCV